MQATPACLCATILWRDVSVVRTVTGLTTHNEGKHLRLAFASLGKLAGMVSPVNQATEIRNTPNGDPYKWQ